MDRIKNNNRLLKISFLSLILFLFFSYIVEKGVLNSLDLNLTVFFQRNISRNWEFPFTLFSLLGTIEITGIIWLIILLFNALKKNWLICLVLLLFPVCTGIEVLGKTIIYHPGPPHLFFRGVKLFDFPRHYIKTSYSYPSGHIIRTSFLITIFLGFLNGLKIKINKFLIIMSIFYLIVMIISRIYLGEHWASDVVGGLLIGIPAGIITNISIRNYAKRHQKN